MDSASTEEKFNSAVELIKSLPKTGSINPSNDTKLKFYSYYKQATQGPCELPKPGFWDIVNRAKWDAWNKLGNMSKEEAMQNYVQEFVGTLKQHSLNDLEDPSVLSDYANLMGPFLELAPKEVRECIIVNGKSKKPLNNNLEDAYPTPVNGHNLNGNNDSDSDEFSDTLERVNEDEPAETPAMLSKPIDGHQPLLNSKGSNIVSVRGGGDHSLGGAEGNSPAGDPASGRGNRFSRQPRSSDYPLQAASNNSLIGGAGGSRRSGGDIPGELSPDVSEQLAMAVIRLQHVMEQVVVRLDSLETLLIQRTSNNASLQVSTRNQSRWSFFGISPKLAFIILAWPFFAQWLMYIIRKRQRLSS